MGCRRHGSGPSPAAGPPRPSARKPQLAAALAASGKKVGFGCRAVVADCAYSVSDDCPTWTTGCHRAGPVHPTPGAREGDQPNLHQPQQPCWPRALRVIRSWLPPATTLSQWWRAWTDEDLLAELQALIDAVATGHGMDLYRRIQRTTGNRLRSGDRRRALLLRRNGFGASGEESPGRRAAVAAPLHRGYALHAGLDEGGQSGGRGDLGEGAVPADAEAVDGAGGPVLHVQKLLVLRHRQVDDALGHG